MNIELAPIGSITPYHKNPRKNSKAVDKVAESIQNFGFNQPIVVDENRVVVVGHTRLKAAQKLKLTEVPVLVVSDRSPEMLQAYRIADNKLNELAEWDTDLLHEELADIVEKLGSAELTGFDFDQMEYDRTRRDDDWKSLNEKYLVPPFSIIDGRARPWLDRKKIWKNSGIRSDEGRSEGLTYPKEGYLAVKDASTSIFDPVLTETLYHWYSAPGQHILDPFAGGSVRGIVARVLGRSYTGIDLRPEQIAANIKNWDEMVQDGRDTLNRYRGTQATELNWLEGDSNVVLDELNDESYDLVFTCPPYADLEVYSDRADDLSTMSYPDFVAVYSSIIKKAADKLKNNRFFVIVVGEVRSTSNGGAYYNFVGDTIKAGIDAGLHYYNEAVYITPNGSLSMRAERPFQAARKLGKHHQNAIVFVKGKGDEAKAELDEIESAYELQEVSNKLLEKHEKVLVFAKGNPKTATQELGEIEVDNLAMLDSINGVDLADLVKGFTSNEQ